jgi:NAD-dependent dihydropyrimidine dehydrogenase PreA subunit
MRIALVTDAWLPQTNGVVRTLTIIVEKLSQAGHEVTPITPADFRTVPCPTYPEVRLSQFAAGKVRRRLDAIDPDRCAHRHRRPAGTGCTALVSTPRPRVYDFISHAVPRVRARSISRAQDWLWVMGRRPRSCAGHTLIGQLPVGRNEIVTSRPDDCRLCHRPTG